jgi:PIN domain nuclease of toxin-antitoxin system
VAVAAGASVKAVQRMLGRAGAAMTLDVYVSPVSPWESTIKQSIGRLSEPIDVAEEIRDSGSHELPITFRHAIAAGRLPPIHRDPFDRMLVAQAQCEGLSLASRDPHIRRYDVALLPV